MPRTGRPSKWPALFDSVEPNTVKTINANPATVRASAHYYNKTAANPIRVAQDGPHRVALYRDHPLDQTADSDLDPATPPDPSYDNIVTKAEALEVGEHFDVSPDLVPMVVQALIGRSRIFSGAQRHLAQLRGGGGEKIFTVTIITGAGMKPVARRITRRH